MKIYSPANLPNQLNIWYIVTLTSLTTNDIEVALFSIRFKDKNAVIKCYS